jgi:hypothetical protein
MKTSASYWWRHAMATDCQPMNALQIFFLSMGTARAENVLMKHTNSLLKSMGLFCLQIYCKVFT